MENDNGKAIERLEKHIPEMAEAAVRQAYWQALASGSSVIVSENGKINEVFPDGTIKFVKIVSPRIEMEKGKIIEIRCRIYSEKHRECECLPAPFGSGKSTMKSVVTSSVLGFYINPMKSKPKLPNTDF